MGVATPPSPSSLSYALCNIGILLQKEQFSCPCYSLEKNEKFENLI